MWAAFACGSAFFAGITAILAKCGIRETDSTVATAIRTIVVLAFAWVMVAVVGSAGQIGSITPMTWAFLGLSGLATGASWLCYFKALQLGDVNKVVPIDKSSTVLTMLLAFLLLGEPLSWASVVAMALILAGTLMMIERKPTAAADATSTGAPAAGGSWLVFAVLSAVFASLTAILGKAGTVRAVPRRELLFICLSGLATGASWLCYYKALQDGLASVVVPIDKLSILVTIGFSRLVFGEKLTARSGAGLALIVAGTLLMVFVR